MGQLWTDDDDGDGNREEEAFSIPLESIYRFFYLLFSAALTPASTDPGDEQPTTTFGRLDLDWLHEKARKELEKKCTHAEWVRLNLLAVKLDQQRQQEEVAKPDKVKDVGSSSKEGNGMGLSMFGEWFKNRYGKDYQREQELATVNPGSQPLRLPTAFALDKPPEIHTVIVPVTTVYRRRLAILSHLTDVRRLLRRTCFTDIEVARLLQLRNKRENGSWQGSDDRRAVMVVVENISKGQDAA